MKKSTVLADGNIYEVTPPITHKGRKYKYVRTYRAKAHSSGILRFPSLSGIEVIKQSKKKDGTKTYKGVDEGGIWNDWGVLISHEDILAKVGYTVEVKATA